MTDRKRWFCRFMSVFALLVAALPAATRADWGPKNEVQAVRGADAVPAQTAQQLLRRQNHA
jgi:hypothetical protein